MATTMFIQQRKGFAYYLDTWDIPTLLLDRGDRFSIHTTTSKYFNTKFPVYFWTHIATSTLQNWQKEKEHSLLEAEYSKVLKIAHIKTLPSFMA